MVGGVERPGGRGVSSWRWQATYRDRSGRHFRGRVRDDARTAYADADSLFENPFPHVAISLTIPRAPNGVTADTRDVNRRNGEWVVGLEKWLEIEREAVAERRA